MKIDKLCNSGYNIKVIYNILNGLYLIGFTTIKLSKGYPNEFLGESEIVL